MELGEQGFTLPPSSLLPSLLPSLPPLLVAAVEIIEQPRDCEGRVGEKVTVICRARGPKGKQLVYNWFQDKPGVYIKRAGWFMSY